jgi:hypothetical protein
VLVYVIQNAERIAHLGKADGVGSVLRLNEQPEAIHERDADAELAKDIHLVVGGAPSNAEPIAGHHQRRRILGRVDEEVIAA